MKKINKKRIVLLIILICLLILQIKAFTDSQANKLLEVTIVAKDNEGLLEDSSEAVEATDEGESGYSLALPEVINEKMVSKYYITEKNAENEEIDSTEVEKKPGEKIYLTEEEAQSQKVELKVYYDTKTEAGTVFYNEQVEQELEDKIVNVKAYVESGANVNIESIAKEEVTEIDDYLYEYGFNSAYSISLEKEDGSKSIVSGNITISIEEENLGEGTNREYKVIHILDDGTLEEIDAKLSKNKIEFETESLSTFVILEKESGSVVDNSEVVDDTMDEAVSNSLIMTMQARTSGEPWDGSVADSFSWGSGTEEEPYLIADGVDLAYLGQQVRNGNTYEGQYFQIANDIDLGGREWTPIGTSQNPFRGILEGAGHTIANATVTVSSLPNQTYESYGIFASIGGGSSRTIIRNLELSSITVQITASGDTGTIDEGSLFGGGSVEQDDEGLHIGTLSGSMYRNSSVQNVIVKSSVIQDTSVINIIDSPFQFSVGGVIGYVGNTYNNNNNPGTGSTYQIDNCYSETQISLDSTAEEGTIDGGWFGNDIDYNGYGQYHTGGIVGTIRGQAVWPTNSLYSGSINSNGFIGPIFGALINNSSYNAFNRFSTIWNGNDAGTVTINNMYYTNYSANGRSFTTSVTSGNSTQRISNSSSNIGYVQGVNKGSYTNNMNTILNVFNNNANNNSSYLPWLYENGTFSFRERLTSSVNEDPEYTYTLEITDPWQIGNYETHYYKNGTEEPWENSSYTWEENYEEDENWVIVTFDGEYYTVTKFTIESLGVDIVFDINENNDSVVASLEGPGLQYTTVDDFTFQWYRTDVSGEETMLEGETQLTLTGLEEGCEYRLVATNTKIPAMSTENSFFYGDRTVIYVDYNNGSNRNDGFTPQTPVQNLSTAYGKLDRNGTTNSNVIVIMGDYSSNSFFNSANSSTYNKPATITGMYDGQDYDGRLYFYSGTSSYRYLTADTNFMYLDWYGTDDSGWFGGTEEQLYLYLQGYSMTIGEGVTMVGYADSNTNQGLLGGNAPAVHIICGWLQYNLRQLPRNNPQIIIKSGTYGRIIGGGSPGTSDGQGQTTSHDFTGSSKEDSFNVTITIDIQNSTTASEYDYDVNLLTGGSAAGNNYSNVIQNIKNGSVGRLIGGSIGDSQTRPRNWNYPENTYLGTSTINVTGGTIDELYGGCLGRNMGVVGSPNATGNTCDSYYYGNITINISGGEIVDNIYGAGAGGVTGYSVNSSDTYKSYGEEFDTSVNINITGGTIRGDIYGGGYGYTEYLNANVTANDGGSLYGDSYINISGSPTIEGNIYAAGRGYNYSSRPNLAQMEGTSNIEISGTPNIDGTIFGAGAGVSGYGEMAKLIGNSNISISANLTSEVYGGGNIARTEGNTNIDINSGNHTAAIYGGGNLGEIQGNTLVNINGGTQETVYGGGNQATVTTSTVNIKGGTNNNVFAGGNQAKVTTTTVNISNGTSNNVYAGGNSADVETTNVYVTGGNTGYIYGGSNQTGTVNNSNIETTGGIMGTVFGGNNIGGTTQDANVNINGGSITEAVYGGGKQVDTNKTTVTLSKSDNQIPSVYGGGNQAGVPETYVYGEGANVKDVFGGSNSSGIVNTTNVEINSGTYETIYGGNNQGGQVDTTNVTINSRNCWNCLWRK